MNIKQVTFTGVDEKTKSRELYAISKDYPFVEWGFLLSPDYAKKGLRFPSPQVLESFGSLEGNKSIHVCGEYARNIAEDKPYCWGRPRALANAGHFSNPGESS